MRKTLLTISTLIILVIIIAWMAAACKKPSDTDNTFEQVIPQGFPPPYYRFADNPLTKDGVELGRRLFYDGRLSVDGLHPCSSCHQQIGGFGTYEHDRSHGVHDSHTLRNAPVLFNLAWNTSFHWDGEFLSLAEEAVHPITGATEMGETFNRVIRKIETDIEYRRLFKKVFHTDVILPIHIQKALAQFTGTIVVFNSKYDRVKRGEAVFTAQEASGYQVFQSSCASCHPEPLFTDYSYRNIGLPIDNFLNDYGRMRITGRSEDSLKFKVPTLRNTYISSNYMHDGRFNTLAQCITHYRSGVQPGATLDPSLAAGITMTNTDAINLALFLRSLTDSSLLNNPQYGPPQ
jgi:cytochrome c peroxidase